MRVRLTINKGRLADQGEEIYQRLKGRLEPEHKRLSWDWNSVALSELNSLMAQ